MEYLEFAVVRQARTWLGTRFHHQGRLKKTDLHAGGVDCLGLLVGVARELELRGMNGTPLHLLDSVDYAHMPNGEVLIKGLRAALQEVRVGTPCMGDILLFTLDGVPRHLAIFSEGEPASMIHAYAQAKRVVEQPLDTWWRERLTHIFRIHS